MSHNPGPLKVHFCGSIPTTHVNHGHICKNLKELVGALLLSGHTVVIRGVPKIDEPKTLVDDIAYQAARDIAARGSWNPNSLFVIDEARLESHLERDFGYQTISSPYTDRRDFYEEILSHSDVIVGIGGGPGLMRIVALAEWTHLPLFALRGAGGEADGLWADILTKCHQSKFLTDPQKESLRRLESIGAVSSDYGPKTAALLVDITYYLKDRLRDTNHSSLDFESITISELISVCKRLTVGSWLTIAGVLGATFAAGAASKLF